MSVEKINFDFNNAKSFLNSLQDMVFIIDIQTKEILFINNIAQKMLGFDLKNANKIGIEKIRQTENLVDFDTHLQDLKQKDSVIEAAYVMRAEGEIIMVEAHAKLVKINNRLYDLAIVRDITHRLEYEKQLRHLNENLEKEVEKKTAHLKENIAFLKSYQKVIDESAIVSKSDIYGRITYANENFCKLTGFTQEEVIGKPHSIVRHPDNDSKIFKKMWDTIRAKKTWKGLLKNKKKDGSHYWVDITIMPILDASNEIVEYIGVRYDVTQLIESKKDLEKIATTDTLTNLGNRFKLIKDLEAKEKFALALIDIDNFNEINDFYGNEIGDIVIKKLGHKIQNYIKDSRCELYRLQGDQFAVLQKKPQEEFADFIQNINVKLSAAKYSISNKVISYQTTASISFEKNSDLIATADMAKKYAKNKRMHFFIYDKSLDFNKEYESNLHWALKIKQALNEERIVPYFQGIYNNKTQQIEKYECLVRMIDEDKVISPFFFLDTAKKSKQYIDITKTMIAKSFEFFSTKEYEFSINLTLEDIECDETTAYLFDAMQKYKIKKNQLVIEIVESEGIDDNNEKVAAFMQKIKQNGAKVAIDDFGTGYSNFIYLIKFSADYVKIDGSMIKYLHEDEAIKEVVKTIVKFAKEMGMKTIAEFVSSKEIHKKVVELGIDYSQGFLFHEPSPKI